MRPCSESKPAPPFYERKHSPSCTRSLPSASPSSSYAPPAPAPIPPKRRRYPSSTSGDSVPPSGTLSGVSMIAPEIRRPENRNSTRNGGSGFEPASNTFVDAETCLLNTLSVTSTELKRWLAKQGCTFGTQTGSHLKVYLGDKMTVIPMHGKTELPSGLVHAVKSSWG